MTGTVSASPAADEGPVPAAGDFMQRDALWYAHSVRADRAGAIHDTEVSEDVAGTLPAAARPDRRTPLPSGVHELLERVPYPQPAGGEPSVGHALAAAFGVQRREPANPFNDHRAYPSVRSKFPVGIFVADGARRQVLDPYRHALLDLDAPDAESPRQVALAGHYTRLPSVYKSFRGSLVNIELGVNLRALCVGLELFGHTASLRLPGADGPARLASFGLTPTWEWTLPLTVELDGPTPAGPQDSEDTPPDPILAGVVAINRAQDFAGAPSPIRRAIPVLDKRDLSWAELLWRRTSGGMPRGLYGMNGRRRQVPAAVLHDAAAWLAVPPPGPLADIAEAITVSAVVQAIDGYRDGVHRVAAGHAELHIPTTDAATRLEAVYGYPLAPGNGCDVRHACLLWFFSMRPRDLVDRFGPGAWTAAQYVCGWAAQGLCLSAAAHGLYARPVRAFEEIPTRRVLGLDTDEMVVLAVISGTPRHRGPSFDLRL